MPKRSFLIDDLLKPDDPTPPKKKSFNIADLKGLGSSSQTTTAARVPSSPENVRLIS